MLTQKLIIKDFILKKECADKVTNFYDPFASFYMLPVVHVSSNQFFLLINGLLEWKIHAVHVGAHNTRQLRAKEYDLDNIYHFDLRLHLIQQKKSIGATWKTVLNSFSVPVSHDLSTKYFESYLLATIPVDWQTSQQHNYENDLIYLEIIKK